MTSRLSRPTLFLSLLVILSAFSTPYTHAARAVFSADGTRIYFSASRLKMLELNHPEHFQILTSSTLWGEKIDAVARANDGNILCLTNHHLGSYDPQRRIFRPLRDANPADPNYDNLAVNPANGYILLTSGSSYYTGEANKMKFWLLQPDDPSPMQVFSRRVFAMEGPIFDPQGRLYFSYQGDLWRGGIEMQKLDDDETSTPENLRGVLNAVRIAPLCRPETAEGTPEGTRVMEIAPAGPLIYIHTQRMYGTGWGSIFTIATPPESDESHGDGEYSDLIATLYSIKEIDTAGTATCICVSPDGRTVFYKENRSFWVIRNGGKPEKLPLHEELWDF